jgi:hypothetical protein
MKIILTNLISSGLISFLLILPFTIMEVVNRRNFNEDFPFVLFFVLWLNLFAISLILLPIVRARRAGKNHMANPVPAQRDTLLTNPKSALIMSVVLLLSVAIPTLLSALGWAPMERLLNSLNPEQFSVFGVRVSSQFVALVLSLLPITAGIIASGPIASTLRAGGSLFTYPFHFIIVAVILFPLAVGVVSFIMDQWPCFMGMLNCD